MHLTLRKAAAAACLLLAAGATRAAADPLQNAVINASYSAGSVLSLGDNYAGGSVSGLDPYNVSAEFFTADALFGFDFSADGQLTIFNNASIPAGSYVASFDFGATLGAPIADFRVVDAGITGGTPVLTIVNDHTISIDLSAVQWNGDFSPLVTAVTLQAVPEPATAWMLAAGLIGLSAAMRARRRNR
ncbi:PEP-CTERM sorting domain-containing protein [Pseudoduganella sp. FT55W]|uniref:PEP-CTERM sorting domain-containing protein n=1 Tax=Duganella rivi TaxID=2666083 RepID=A0A7X4GNJ8_9BURK|nr:PEP-CTERM sorting domain-containing protein [Duganella rivi]MYM66763.1 PEP-CTERM sorting domain-containing protein [Duganella rivi]